MLADTMIPEAFENAHDYAGLITVAGFQSPSCCASWVDEPQSSAARRLTSLSASACRRRM